MFNKKFLISIIIILVGLLGGYLIYQNSQSALLGQVKIQTDIDIYTPIMSSTVGIGLTPICAQGEPPESVKFHWRTNYGYFVSWNQSDFKVHKLGTETVNNGEKIYWSYDPAEMDEEKPLVQISLGIKDTQSGDILTQSNLEIIWKDNQTAEVKSKN